MVETSDGVPDVDAATLAPLVGSLLGSDASIDGPWSTQPLHGGFGGQGLFRFAGRARLGDGTQTWSLILKIAPPQPHDDPHGWTNPRREASAYRSGFLAELPGPLVAPRCLGLTERPDGSSWMWLEDIVDERPGPWDLDRYALAARHLGRFNGAWLAAGPLPDRDWLSRDWLRRYITAEGAAARELTVADDAPPLLRQCFPPQSISRIRQLWAERETYLAALDRLSQTICHHDAFRRNLFARRGSDGTEQTVAVDWAFLGVGAVGAEVAPLVLGSLLFFEVTDADPHELVETALVEYMTGLRETGWDGDARAVRLGFLATAALLYTVGPVGLVVAELSDPTQYPALERGLGRSMAETVENWVKLQGFQFALADEAQRLLTVMN
jgi:hypothetical protein